MYDVHTRYAVDTTFVALREQGEGTLRAEHSPTDLQGGCVLIIVVSLTLDMH
jgi:hypothetical protein